MRGKRFGLLLTIVAIAQAICGQALGQASALPGSNVMISPTGGGFLNPRALVSQDLYQQGTCASGTAFINSSGAIACTPGPAGTVTSVNHSFTGGLISASGGPVTATGTLALAVAGTSGGVPYFSGANTWASSSPLASGQLVQGGGAGQPPSTFALGGDCTLASPNITCTKTGGVAFTPLATLPTGAAGTVLAGGASPSFSANPTLSGGVTVAGPSNLSGGSGGNPTIYGNDAGLTAVGTAPFTFVTAESLASYASGTTHFGFAINDTKNVVGANSTGSREAFIAQMLGAGGGVADFFTGAEFLAKPTAGANNNSGNFTGDNPYCYIPSGMTPTSCVAQETDITTLSNVTNIREALRVVDLGSTGSYGAGVDAAIGLSATGIGFKNGLYFGESGGGSFPLAASGTAISFEAGTVTNVVDAHLLTVSGNAWQSPGFTVSGAGVASSTGVTNGANAAAGVVGEVIRSNVPIGSAVSLVTGTPKTITSIALTAGDWDCRGDITFNPAGTTTISFLGGSINNVTNTMATQGTNGMFYFVGAFGTGVASTWAVGTFQINLGAGATEYLVGQANFATSTMTAYGYAECRRMR